MLIRQEWICFTVFTLFSFYTAAADDLQVLNSETAQLYAKHLVEKFEKEHPNRQSKFEVDVSLAKGLHVGEDGIIMVPAKGLKDDTIDPAVEMENGAGLCYLFMSSCYPPTVDGKAIDSKKLRRISFTNGQGIEQQAYCLVMTVKHKDGDDWRLLGYGEDQSPVINSQFAESSANVDKPVAITVSSVKANKANISLTLFQKYAASFGISAK